jgi:hypothetical protein
MYAYAVDRSSGQFKAPFNQIFNEHRVFTYEDTAIIAPNSDTPYSGDVLDLRSEPIVISVPAVDLRRYYSVMLTDGNTYNYGYIGSRATGGEAGDYMVVGPEWRGSTPAGIKKVFRSGTAFSLPCADFLKLLRRERAASFDPAIFRFVDVENEPRGGELDQAKPGSLSGSCVSI